MDTKKIIYESQKGMTKITCEFILEMWAMQPGFVFTKEEVTAKLERFQKMAMENIEKQKP